LRHSSGGLRYVKGLGLEVDGQAQVSMNLVDTEKTPLYRAFDMVKMEAAAQGVLPTWSEIVGLVPERALLETAARHAQRLREQRRVVGPGAGRRQCCRARRRARRGARTDGGRSHRGQKEVCLGG